MKIFLVFLSLTGHLSMIAGISFVISRSLYTSFITILFFHSGVPLGWFFDFLCAGSQSPMGQIPNFPSHQAFREVLNRGHTTAHRYFTFVVYNLCLTEHLGFFTMMQQVSFLRPHKKPFLVNMNSVSHVLIFTKISRIPERQCHLKSSTFVLF